MFAPRVPEPKPAALPPAPLETAAATPAPATAEEEFETFTPDSIPEEEEEEFFSFGSSDSIEEEVMEMPAVAVAVAPVEPALDLKEDLLTSFQTAQEEIAPGAEHHAPAVLAAPEEAPAQALEPLPEPPSTNEESEFSFTPEPTQDPHAEESLRRLVALRDRIQTKTRAVGASGPQPFEAQSQDPEYLHWHEFLVELRGRFLGKPASQKAAA